MKGDDSMRETRTYVDYTDSIAINKERKKRKIIKIIKKVSVVSVFALTGFVSYKVGYKKAKNTALTIMDYAFESNPENKNLICDAWNSGVAKFFNDDSLKNFNKK